MKYPFGKPPEGADVLWRCESKRYSYVIDADADRYGVTAPELEMWWYPVKKRTPKGAWLDDRFVLLTARKQWACETEALAVASFKARKQRQIDILSNQLRKAKEDMALCIDGLTQTLTGKHHA